MQTYTQFETSPSHKCDCCGQTVPTKEEMMLFYYQDDYEQEEISIYCENCFRSMPVKEYCILHASPTFHKMPPMKFPEELSPYKEFLMCKGVDIEDSLADLLVGEEEHDRRTDFDKVEVMLLQRLYKAGVLK